MNHRGPDDLSEGRQGPSESQTVRRLASLSRHACEVLFVGTLAVGAGCGPRAATPGRPTLITKEQEDAARRKEIKALEKSLDEEIVKARAKGATDADIEVLKSKYQEAIDRLRDELANGEKTAPEVPKDAGP
jgi:hypothetical protein